MCDSCFKHSKIRNNWCMVLSKYQSRNFLLISWVSARSKMVCCIIHLGFLCTQFDEIFVREVSWMIDTPPFTSDQADHFNNNYRVIIGSRLGYVIFIILVTVFRTHSF